MQAAKPVSNQSSAPSVASEEQRRDRGFYVSFGLIISARLADLEKIRESVQAAGGKIAFQTSTPAPLYLLRHYEVEQILQGDSSALAELREVHDRKSRERRVEKI